MLKNILMLMLVVAIIASFSYAMHIDFSSYCSATYGETKDEEDDFEDCWCIIISNAVYCFEWGVGGS